MSEFAGKQEVEMALWDSESSEEYDRLQALIYHEADMFILAYSVARPESLQRIEDRVRAISFNWVAFVGVIG